MTQVLTERVARDWVTPNEWRKGESYVRELSRLTQRPAEVDKNATEYRALAHGRQTYRVSVTAEGGKVSESDCTCPVGPHCKHVAALLNRLTMGDADFVQIPALNDVLDALEVPDLRQLVRRLIDKAPELEPLVYANAAKKITSGGRLSDFVPNFVPQIQAAFDLLPSDEDLYEWSYSEAELDTSELDEVIQELNDWRVSITDWNREQTEAVARAYIAILEGIDSFYEGEIDYGLDDLQAEAIAGMYDLFARAEHLAGDLRDDALEAIYTELVSGRLDFGSEFVNWFGMLLPAEQQLVQAQLQKLSNTTSNYQRKRYLQALIDLRGGEATDEETETLLRAEGNMVGLTEFFVARGRTAEAITALKKYQYPLPFAELQPIFERLGMLGQLEDMALSLKNNDRKAALLWLYDLYSSTQRPQQAYALALEQAKQRADKDWFKRLKQSSPKWQTERDQLIEHHWKTGGNTLLELLITEELPDPAYDFVQSPNIWADSLCKVAQMTTLDDQRAATLYVRAARQTMAGRNRAAYNGAAAILRNLIGRLGKKEAQAMVEAYFPERKNLPALRDELTKAGLLKS